jgi:2-keto-4-pentenoate hydratase/2-oxohepta-3-ene-1,7-dioic acid hydratase in catechol pathway
LNGQLRQQFNTRGMIWSFGECLEYLTRDFTLQPGDIISGGTGLGTAIDSTPTLPDGSMAKDLFPQIGDVLELSSPLIGTLRNRIVAKRPRLD